MHVNHGVFRCILVLRVQRGFYAVVELPVLLQVAVFDSRTRGIGPQRKAIVRQFGTVFFELFSPTIKSLARYTVIGVLTVELLNDNDQYADQQDVVVGDVFHHDDDGIERIVDFAIFDPLRKQSGVRAVELDDIFGHLLQFHFRIADHGVL